jgi:predicted CopG family antitoxin
MVTDSYIRASKNLQRVLKKMKKFERESYEDVIKRILKKKEFRGLE